MNLRKLNDTQLHVSTVRTAEKQREITLELLNHLNEVERRHLHSKFKCSSLHGYCVQELKMTSGNASHHINAARLVKQIPEIQEKVLSGSIAVTTVASAEAFFKKEARSGNKFDLEEKQEILSQLESLATREADKVLLSHASKPEIHFREKITQKTESIVELKVHFDEETIQMLGRIKEIWSHAMPHASFADLIKRALKEAIEKNDPLKKIERAETRAKKKAEKSDACVMQAEEKAKREKSAQELKAKDSNVQDAETQDTEIQETSTHEPTNHETSAHETSAQDVKTSELEKTPALGFEGRAISETAPALPELKIKVKPGAKSKAEIRHIVWHRDQARCTFVDPRTGERCNSRHFLEEDHIVPRAMGGEFTVENMRLRCRAHNQRHAIHTYGVEKMRRHLHKNG